MAKRYKKKKKNKKFLLCLICIVLILVIVYCIYTLFINKNDEQTMQNDVVTTEQVTNNDNEIKNEDNEQKETDQSKDNDSDSDNNDSEDNISLDADVLVPKDLDSDIRSKLAEKIEDADVVRVHYKLKTLEEGTAQVYYKLENSKIYLVEVDIASKSITDYKEIEDEDLEKKSSISDNLEEDVKQDFEKYKDRITEESGRLNIIISNTEIIINVSYEQ